MCTRNYLMGFGPNTPNWIFLPCAATQRLGLPESWLLGTAKDLTLATHVVSTGFACGRDACCTTLALAPRRMLLAAGSLPTLLQG